jgi:hypothetical protein
MAVSIFPKSADIRSAATIEEFLGRMALPDARAFAQAKGAVERAIAQVEATPFIESESLYGIRHRFMKRT